MKEDPTIAEIREVRHRISASVGHDPWRLVEHYRQLQERHHDRLAHRKVEASRLKDESAAWISKMTRPRTPSPQCGESYFEEEEIDFVQANAVEETKMPTESEYQIILNKCRLLPPPEGNYHINDYILNLMLTVLDYRMNPTTLAKAENHYKQNHWHEIRTHNDLVDFLSRFPDNKTGNVNAASYLWGNKYGNRLQQLRGLLKYFDSVGVKDQKSLQIWAQKSNFERDFKGEVKGLAFAIYKWLVMRQRIETVKPDVHIKDFLREITNRHFTDQEAVSILERAAKELNRPANELDWSIWEMQRNKF